MFIFSLLFNSTIKLSARLATVRALCKYDALRDPPGKMNEFKLDNGLLNLSMVSSSLVTWFLVTLSGGNFGDLVIGFARSAPRSNKSF